MTEFRNILVRTPNWVGDAVMALPFLASLRLNAPAAEISILTRPNLSEFFSQVRSCDHVIALDESHGRHGLSSVWHNAPALRPKKFDLGFCLTPSFGAALMMRLAGVRRRVGHASDHRGWLLTDRLPYLPNGKRPHRTESYLALLSMIWPNAQIERNLAYDPGADSRSSAQGIWRTHRIPDSARVLAVAPGAAQPNKLWSAARFSEVCNRWLNQADSVVIIVGGPGDRDACDAVLQGVGGDRVHNLCDTGTLSEVAATVQRSTLFVGNDSGLSHLAAAVGTPVVVISGPGDPSEVAPFTAAAITVKKSLFCSPCYRNTCYRSDHPLECQDLVGVEDVWNAVTELHSGMPGRGVTS